MSCSEPSKPVMSPWSPHAGHDQTTCLATTWPTCTRAPQARRPTARMQRTAERHGAASRRDIAASTTSRVSRARFAARPRPCGASAEGTWRKSVIQVAMRAMQPRARVDVSPREGAPRNHDHAGGSTGTHGVARGGVTLHRPLASHLCIVRTTCAEVARTDPFLVNARLAPTSDALHQGGRHMGCCGAVSRRRTSL